MSLTRIYGLFLRHFYLISRSFPRILDLIYWPSIQITLWGFISNFFAANSNYYGGAVGVILSCAILYDFLFRTSIGFNMLFLEEIWSRNFTNLFIAPMKISEIIVSLVFTALIRALIGLVPAILLTSPLFGISLLDLGLPLAFLFLSLYIFGITLGILSAFFASLFTVMNGKFVELYSPSVISFYEFISGVFIISIFLSFSDNGFDVSFFNLSIADWIYLLILASVCTAYAFIGSICVMRYITPYSVVLTYNLEPIYGFSLAVIFFPNTELMSPLFYFGAGIIIATILLNGFIKHKTGKINF